VDGAARGGDGGGGGLKGRPSAGWGAGQEKGGGVAIPQVFVKSLSHGGGGDSSQPPPPARPARLKGGVALGGGGGGEDPLTRVTLRDMIFYMQRQKRLRRSKRLFLALMRQRDPR
jgi:hypothetical protein